jgi:lamin tail-like protein
MGKCFFAAAACAAMLALADHASAAPIYITEFCSDTGNNQHFEFVEFTNCGSTPVDMTGWSEDDSSATPDKSGHSLTGLGTLNPGESGIITEATPADFRAYWGLSTGVPVVGPYTNDNLNTISDSITLFNSSETLVDRLDYSTSNGGSADMVTRNCPLDALGKNDNALWVNSYIGDAFGSFPAPQKTSIIGNPGAYPLPEPAGLGLIGACAALMARRRVRRADSISSDNR